MTPDKRADLLALAERLREQLKHASPNDRAYERPMSWEDADALLDALDTAAAEIERLRGGVEVKALKCALCGEDHDNDLGSDICTTCEARAEWTGLDANEARIRSAIQGGENAE